MWLSKIFKVLKELLNDASDSNIMKIDVDKKGLTAEKVNSKDEIVYKKIDEVHNKVIELLKEYHLEKIDDNQSYFKISNNKIKINITNTITTPGLYHLTATLDKEDFKYLKSYYVYDYCTKKNYDKNTRFHNLEYYNDIVINFHSFSYELIEYNIERIKNKIEKIFEDLELFKTKDKKIDEYMNKISSIDEYLYDLKDISYDYSIIDNANINDTNTIEYSVNISFLKENTVFNRTFYFSITNLVFNQLDNKVLEINTYLHEIKNRIESTLDCKIFFSFNKNNLSLGDILTISIVFDLFSDIYNYEYGIYPGNWHVGSICNDGVFYPRQNLRDRYGVGGNYGNFV